MRDMLINSPHRRGTEQREMALKLKPGNFSWPYKGLLGLKRINHSKGLNSGSFSQLGFCKRTEPYRKLFEQLFFPILPRVVQNYCPPRDIREKLSHYIQCNGCPKAQGSVLLLSRKETARSHLQVGEGRVCVGMSVSDGSSLRQHGWRTRRPRF